jgi:hypothetical protein
MKLHYTGLGRVQSQSYVHSYLKHIFKRVFFTLSRKILLKDYQTQERRPDNG